MALNDSNCIKIIHLNENRDKTTNCMLILIQILIVLLHLDLEYPECEILIRSDTFSWHFLKKFCTKNFQKVSLEIYNDVSFCSLSCFVIQLFNLLIIHLCFLFRINESNFMFILRVQWSRAKRLIIWLKKDLVKVQKVDWNF